MIAFIEGKLISATPLQAVVETGGLGYDVHIPVTTAEKLPATGKPVKLHTHVVYREDAQTLFGFTTREERDFFRLLVEKVSGVGPKVALSILSKLSLPNLQTAIASGDTNLLAKCPGIGKKTAERLVIELKDKVGFPSPRASGGPVSGAPGGGPSASGETPPSRNAVYDALQALIALGMKPADADKAVRKALEVLGPDASPEELVKSAFR